MKPMGKGIKTRVSAKKGIKAIDKATLGWITAPNPVYPNGAASTTDTGRNPFRVKKRKTGVL